jgi:hypothetical protein
MRPSFDRQLVVRPKSANLNSIEITEGGDSCHGILLEFGIGSLGFGPSLDLGDWFLELCGDTPTVQFQVTHHAKAKVRSAPECHIHAPKANNIKRDWPSAEIGVESA